MSIKSTGGVFGRNPTFNNVTVDGDLDLGVSGDIKFTSTEAKISTINNDLMIGTDDTALRFDDGDDAIFPVNLSSGSKRNNVVTIGASNAQIKDIYMGGNLIVSSGSGIDFSATSGTGTSELFDDYEEGVFTPTLTTSDIDFSSVTYDAAVFGSYTKVGNVVHIQLLMQTDEVIKGSASGNVLIGGLPFTADGTSPLAVATSKDWLANHPTRAYVADGATTISLLTNASNTADDENVVVAYVKTLGNDNTLRLSGTYRAS